MWDGSYGFRSTCFGGIGNEDDEYQTVEELTKTLDQARADAAAASKRKVEHCGRIFDEEAKKEKARLDKATRRAKAKLKKSKERKSGSGNSMLDLRGLAGWQVRTNTYSSDNISGKKSVRQYRNQSLRFGTHESIRKVTKFLNEIGSHQPLSNWSFPPGRGEWKNLTEKKWHGSASVREWSSTLNSYGPEPPDPMSADQIRKMANDAWTIARPELSGESCSALFQNGHATGDVVSYCAYSGQFGSKGFSEAIGQFCASARNPTMVLVDPDFTESSFKIKTSPITFLLEAFRRADDATAFEKKIQEIMQGQMNAPHFLHRIAGNGPKIHNANMALLIHRVFITFFYLDGEVGPDGRTGTINGNDVRFTHA